MTTRVYALLLLLGLWTPASWAACSAEHYDARGQVAYVYDGDTVRLANGDKVRFIGINAPEIAHQHGADQSPSQPQGDAARAYLQRLLSHNTQVYLIYGAERYDHYHRRLAHLFLSDGRNLNELMLRQGLAFRIAFPPNLRFQACYQAAEQVAHDAGLGVWSTTRFWILDATRVAASDVGFRLVQGRVVAIEETRKSLWLVLEGGRLHVRIARADLAQLGFDPHGLTGRRVLVRGWLYVGERGDILLRLHQGADLVLLEP